MTSIVGKEMEVSGDHQLFDYQLLQNIIFYVQHKKETHLGLERHEWVNDNIFIKMFNYPFKHTFNNQHF